jgi:hypothetical protein
MLSLVQRDAMLKAIGVSSSMQRQFSELQRLVLLLNVELAIESELIDDQVVSFNFARQP